MGKLMWQEYFSLHSHVQKVSKAQSVIKWLLKTLSPGIKSENQGDHGQEFIQL
jgi:hypothetical protein